MKLKQNEEAFALTPVGVKYTCEHCHEGEMKVVVNSPDEPNPVPLGLGGNMRRHRCDKCNGELFLSKVYPYIEWLPENEIIRKVFKNDGSYLTKEGLIFLIECLDKRYKLKEED